MSAIEMNDIDWGVYILHWLHYELFIINVCRGVLFEYHQAVVPICWAVRPVRSLSTL